MGSKGPGKQGAKIVATTTAAADRDNEAAIGHGQRFRRGGATWISQPSHGPTRRRSTASRMLFRFRVRLSACCARHLRRDAAWQLGLGDNGGSQGQRHRRVESPRSAPYRSNDVGEYGRNAGYCGGCPQRSRYRPQVAAAVQRLLTLWMVSRQAQPGWWRYGDSHDLSGRHG